MRQQKKKVLSCSITTPSGKKKEYDAEKILELILVCSTPQAILTLHEPIIKVSYRCLAWQLF